MVQLKIYSLDGVSALRSCPPSDARCSVSWLYTVNWIKIGNQKSREKTTFYYGITTELCPCDKSFVCTNSETGTCRESCFIHFPTKPPCSTRVDVLETDDVPVLFSLPQMQNLGVTLQVDPEGVQSTCPAFGLYSSLVEYSTVGHIVLDMTSLAYHPKLREQSARPTKHVTVALSQRKSTYPARVQELDDDEDDKPFVRPDSTTVSEKDEDDKPLVQLASRGEPVKRESSAKRRVPTPFIRLMTAAAREWGPELGLIHCVLPGCETSS